MHLDTHVGVAAEGRRVQRTLSAAQGHLQARYHNKQKRRNQATSVICPPSASSCADYGLELHAASAQSQMKPSKYTRLLLGTV